MARRALTRDELHTASRYLAHTWIVFVSALRQAAELPSDFRQEEVRRALLSVGAALQLRNLLDFFDPGDKAWDTDLIAKDFISDWDTIKPPRPPLFQDALSYAGKFVAHLTHERLKHPDHVPILPFHELLALLAPYHEAFICNVDPDKLDKTWKDNMSVFGVVSTHAGPVFTEGGASGQDVSLSVGLRPVEPQQTAPPQFWRLFGPEPRR